MLIKKDSTSHKIWRFSKCWTVSSVTKSWRWRYSMNYIYTYIYKYTFFLVTTFVNLQFREPEIYQRKSSLSYLHSFLTVYPKKYAHGFCFAVLCCGYTLTDFPISIRLTSLALWQSNDCPSASKATLMNHNKAKHNKTVCIFLGIYCSSSSRNCDMSFDWWSCLIFF